MDQRPRRQTTLKKYTVDAFEGIEELKDVTPERGSSIEDDSAASGDDFAVGEEEQDEDDNIADSPMGDEASEIELDGRSNIGDDALDDDASIINDLDSPGPGDVSKRKRIRRPKPRILEAEQVHLRGIAEGVMNNTSKDQRNLHYFGASTDDQHAGQQAKAQWAFEPTLPSRGGFHRSFYQTDAAVVEQAQQDWAWYYQHGGRETFTRRQSLQRIDNDAAVEYMCPVEEDQSDFLMGPYNNQKLFTLAVGQSVPLTDAWPAEISTADNGSMREHRARYKPGLMLNLGGKVQCLEWAPNRFDGIHYLAVSVVPLHRPTDTSVAPAFTPQPPFKSAIQMWQIHASPEECIDTAQPPRRVLTYCTNWGDIKSFAWCPTPCELGNASLLAFISGDGALRIVDMSLDTSQDSNNYILEQAAFQSAPPNTLCTCVAWLSSSRIAAGCANGCIAIWYLPASLNSTSPNARPTIYSSISTSYIFTIVSCAPSHPSFLMASSATGFLSLTDLRHPSPASPSATVYSQRCRLASRLLLWHDFAQAALTIDDTFSLRAYPFRRWFCTLGAGRGRSLATCMTGSPWHPFVLIGGANGEVVGTNPLNRLLSGRASVWQQVWFAHEWRRPLRCQQNGVAMAGGEQEDAREAILQKCLSRITEGYKAETVAVAKDDRIAGNEQDGGVFATVYEERTAVTALAWNPNQAAAGWAAAGMANGLVRIEDIAV